MQGFKICNLDMIVKLISLPKYTNSTQKFWHLIKTKLKPNYKKLNKRREVHQIIPNTSSKS